MKCSLLLLLALSSSLAIKAQISDTSRIGQLLSNDQILAPLRYLASDRLRGRHIGLPEIDTAARYIASQFRKAGAKPIAIAGGYYQKFSYTFDRADRFRMYRQVAYNIPWDRELNLKNVLAIMPGTDPVLRNQYIILSSHYDHVGLASLAVEENGKMDSIYNGAMDNATGTAAVIAAAKYFGRYPPKRSVIFICYTAEEEGEIGSNYYAEHPLVPLDHTVYNLNVDNAGYDTTGAVCLFGLGRTSADTLVRMACMAYGLAVLPEPGGQNFFNRSDNYALAQKGIPAPTYSLGMIDWDEEAMRHYHMLSDEVGNMDMGYTVKFIRAYILSAKYIADDNLQPKWVKNDPFEKAWQALFKKDQ